MTKPTSMIRGLPLAVALTGLFLTAPPAGAQITIDDFGAATVNGIQNSFTLADFFDASGSDKLVVTVSMERDRGDPNTAIAEVTYNGTPLVEAVSFKDAVDYNPPGIGPAAIYYLDRPGPAGPIVATGSAKMNGAHGSWLALSGTADGVGPTNGDTGASISLTTEVNDSLVVAHNHVNEGAVPEAQPPLTPLLRSDARYSEAASGYLFVSSPGAVTLTFSAGTTPVTVAAAFEPSGGTATNGFKRGDANRDGGVNIADAIATLEFLFGTGLTPPCPDAADANDDGTVNIADAIAALGHLFGGAGDLPPPFGSCGSDPTADGLDPCDYPQTQCE